MCGILGIEIIVLAAPAPVLPIRRGDLENLDPCGLQEAQEPRAVAASGFDPHALKLAQTAHPSEHLAIALSRRGKAAGSEDSVMVVNDGGHVQVLVRVDAADNTVRGIACLVHVWAL